MARIRTIKPEFWVDEKIGECSTNARLLFIASWSFADDKGSLERSAKQLKAQAFPYDTIDCEPLVQELLKAGLLVEYTGDDRKMYLHVNHFSEHQRIDRPGKPRVPLYRESANAQVGLHDDSTNGPRALAAGLGVIRDKDKNLRHPVDNGDNGDNSAKGARHALNGAGASKGKGNGHHVATVPAEAEEAWRVVIAQGPRTPRIHKALEKIGGYQAVRFRTPHTEPKLKRDFLEAFEAA